MSFAGRHGRMPVTAEKEPIRPLYKRYNAQKIHIGDMETYGRRKGLSTIDSSSETLSSSPPTDEVEKASSTTCVQASSHGVRCTHVEDDGDGKYDDL